MTDRLKGDYELIQRLRAISPRDGEIDRAILRSWQVRTVRGAKLKVRRKTGNLGRSIHAGKVSGNTATVEASAAYAAAIEFGARPHVIVPRHARVLAWGGARRLSGNLRKGAKPEFFAMKVNHPGNRAFPFLAPAGREALEEVDMAREIVLHWNEAA